VNVIDGATNDRTTVAAGTSPVAVAVNSVTNKVYVANFGSDNVTVIDGGTYDTTLIPADSGPSAVVVNSVTNKVYVANWESNNVTVIDGATNATTTVPAGSAPWAVAVNPVMNRIYVANSGSGSVTVITDVPSNDTKVRAAFEHLPGDTTSLARPTLAGKGVNRSEPGRTAMMGVGNRMNTAQTAWGWATITYGAGTDSITWSYNWGPDSLIAGENFVCCVPLEDQAAITNNLGLGTPFAGNLEVYPVYRMKLPGGLEEAARTEARMTRLPAIVRGVLFLQGDRGPGTGDRAALLDIAGRKVIELQPGANDVRSLSPGVYFVRSEPSAVSREPSAVTKVVIQR
jgi:YVTN family beta-propeller protein